MKYQITGGKKLAGTVPISGNKNAVFPCVAAALLTEEEVVLENISNLKDTEVLIKILKKLGVNAEKTGTLLRARSPNLKIIFPELVPHRNFGSCIQRY